MFRDTRDYEYLVNLFTSKGIIDKALEFSCYTDSIMMFELLNQGYRFEFSIIADAEYWRGITLIELMETKRVHFFEFSEFLSDGEETDRIVWRKEPLGVASEEIN